MCHPCGIERAPLAAIDGKASGSRVHGPKLEQKPIRWVDSRTRKEHLERNKRSSAMSMLSIFFFLAVMGLALWSIGSILVAESERILSAMAGPQAAAKRGVGHSNVIVFTLRTKAPIDLDRMAA
jgi:hypothetical protein